MRSTTLALASLFLFGFCISCGAQIVRGNQPPSANMLDVWREDEGNGLALPEQLKQLKEQRKLLEKDALDNIGDVSKHVYEALWQLTGPAPESEKKVREECYVVVDAIWATQLAIAKKKLATDAPMEWDRGWDVVSEIIYTLPSYPDAQLKPRSVKMINALSAIVLENLNNKELVKIEVSLSDLLLKYHLKFGGDSPFLKNCAASFPENEREFFKKAAKKPRGHIYSEWELKAWAKREGADIGKTTILQAKRTIFLKNWTSLSWPRYSCDAKSYLPMMKALFDQVQDDDEALIERLHSTVRRTPDILNSAEIQKKVMAWVLRGKLKYALEYYAFEHLNHRSELHDAILDNLFEKDLLQVPSRDLGVLVRLKPSKGHIKKLLDIVTEVVATEGFCMDPKRKALVAHTMRAGIHLSGCLEKSEVDRLTKNLDSRNAEEFAFVLWYLKILGNVEPSKAQLRRLARETFTVSLVEKPVPPAKTKGARRSQGVEFTLNNALLLGATAEDFMTPELAKLLSGYSSSRDKGATHFARQVKMHVISLLLATSTESLNKYLTIPGMGTNRCTFFLLEGQTAFRSTMFDLLAIGNIAADKEPSEQELEEFESGYGAKPGTTLAVLRYKSAFGKKMLPTVLNDALPVRYATRAIGLLGKSGMKDFPKAELDKLLNVAAKEPVNPGYCETLWIVGDASVKQKVAEQLPKQKGVSEYLALMLLIDPKHEEISRTIERLGANPSTMDLVPFVQWLQTFCTTGVATELTPKAFVNAMQNDAFLHMMKVVVLTHEKYPKSEVFAKLTSPQMLAFFAFFGGNSRFEYDAGAKVRACLIYAYGLGRLKQATYKTKPLF